MVCREGKVGKSSILLRFVHDQFNKNHLSTVQASFMNKKINFDNKRVNLNVWDTAGQEIFHALGKLQVFLKRLFKLISHKFQDQFTTVTRKGQF